MGQISSWGADSAAHPGGLARDAYDALAPFYDSFTHDYEYEGWLAALEDWAEAAGLCGRDLLDAGCGTGKSFLPLMRSGYRVTACDISSEMVQRARGKAQGAAHVVVADMRSLPWVSRFDLITCLDDAVNYLLAPEELEAALTSMWAALRPGGILIFDTNSLATYRDVFSTTFATHDSSTRFCWRGGGGSDVAAGSICEATLEVADAITDIATHHVQRHWPVSVLHDIGTRVGFKRIEFRGQVTGGRVVGAPDEGAHAKVVCLARKHESASSAA